MITEEKDGKLNVIKIKEVGDIMQQIYKYPRTPHIAGSRIQSGDEDLKTIPFELLQDKFLVIEEKVDGANLGISFDDQENIRLQSRGHYLTGGYRERHFNLLKTWALTYSSQLYQVLGNRYVLYGEWLFAKHTVFYDKLPHYFFEFDILDLQEQVFLSTERRRAILAELPFVVSVPVLKEGCIKNVGELASYIRKSLYKSEGWKDSLKRTCEKENIDFETVLKQTDCSDLSEGVYIKWEEDGVVKGRYKFVRKEFIAQILSNDSHWLDRPIVPNLLESGDLEWV